jgi:hypothetical protein
MEEPNKIKQGTGKSGEITQQNEQWFVIFARCE